jgi:hypothetical protein
MRIIVKIHHSRNCYRLRHIHQKCRIFANMRRLGSIERLYRFAGFRIQRR